MIGVFVRLRLHSGFNEQFLRQTAHAVRSRFEGMPGLRSKAFTIDAANREATNFYVWESEEEARAFFTNNFLERVTALYGVRPQVDFVEIAQLVDNALPAA